MTETRFEWQVGYSAFSVSGSHVEMIRRYIRNQEEHHRNKSFEVELKEFIESHP